MQRMAWHHRQTAPPPSYAYGSSPYSFPHTPHAENHDHRVVGPPRPAAPYGGPGHNQHAHHGPLLSPPSMPPPPADEHWYDYPQIPSSHPSPSPYKHDDTDRRKFERTFSVEEYYSPDRHRPPYSPYQPPPSSIRGGKKLDNRPVNPPVEGSSLRPTPFSVHSNHRIGLHQGLKRKDLSLSLETSDRGFGEIPRSAIKSANTKTQERREVTRTTESCTQNEDKAVKKEEQAKVEPSDDEKKKDGDPLSLLAKVSSEMDSKGSKKGEKVAKEGEKESKGSDIKEEKGKNNNTNSSTTGAQSEKKNEKDNSEKMTSQGKDTKVPPTSPLQRRVQTSPLITPNTSTETDHSATRKEKEHDNRGRQRVVRTLTPKPITPTAAPHYHHYPQRHSKTPQSQSKYNDREPPRDYPYYPSSGSFPPPPESHPYPSYGPSTHARDKSWEFSQQSPVVVEHNSFDSGESSGLRYPSDYSYQHHHPYHGPPPPTPGGLRYYGHENQYSPPPPPPDISADSGVWHTGPPAPVCHREDRGHPLRPPLPHSDYGTPLSPHPTHGWSYDRPPPPEPSPVGHGVPGRYPGAPIPPPPTSSQFHPFPPSSVGPPPPRGPHHYPTPSPYYHHPQPDGSPYDVASSMTTSGTGTQYPPTPQQTALPHHQMPSFPIYHNHMGYAPHFGSGMPPPYTYVQQPRLDEKTFLRKKFSWKHFPELEKFLIDNRDEYLQFSSRNYTVEQKQFNNNLTERLIELAEKHNYIFDPEDFNFVAIRDRIRCYYKSYVQTARKRGLSLPTSSKGKAPQFDHHDDSSAEYA